MKARLTLAVSVILAGLLGSCQQAFVDKEARGSDGPSATLSAPNYGPGDTGPFIVNPVDHYITQAANDAAGVASSGFSVLSGITVVYDPSSSDFSVAGPAPGAWAPSKAAAAPSGGGSGLPGYVILPGFSYDTYNTGPQTLSYGGVSDAGDYQTSTRGYQENSAAWNAETNAPTNATRLYKKAVHRVLDQSTTYNIQFNDGNTSVSGKMLIQQRSEWYKDIFIGPNETGYESQYGITEFSLDFAVTVTASSGYVGGKFVGTCRFSQPLSGTPSAYTANDILYYPIVTIKCYDDKGKEIDPDTTTTFPFGLVLSSTTIYGPADATIPK